jgi:multicomponent Na+:H+ antiporter subunit C
VKLSSNGFLRNLNYAVAVVIMLVGLYAVIARRSPVKKVIGLIVMQSSVFLFFVAMGLVGSGGKRVVTPGFRAATLINPVSHTLVLVGIMLSAGITALSLSLVVMMKSRQRRSASTEEAPSGDEDAPARLLHGVDP